MISNLSNDYLDYEKEKRAKFSGKVQQIRWGAALEFRSAQFEMLVTQEDLGKKRTWFGRQGLNYQNHQNTQGGSHTY